MADSLNKEGTQRKKDNEDFQTKIENERKKVHGDLTIMKEEIKINQDGRELCSQQCRQHKGWSRFQHIRLTASLWKQTGREPGYQGNVKSNGGRQSGRKDMSPVSRMTVVKDVEDQLAECMTKEEKVCVDWAFFEENQGLWPRKTMASSWFVTDKSKMILRIEVLEMVTKDLRDKFFKVNKETVRASLQLSPQQNPWARHRRCFSWPLN